MDCVFDPQGRDELIELIYASHFVQLGGKWMIRKCKKKIVAFIGLVVSNSGVELLGMALDAEQWSEQGNNKMQFNYFTSPLQAIDFYLSPTNAFALFCVSTFLLPHHTTSFFNNQT